MHMYISYTLHTHKFVCTYTHSHTNIYTHIYIHIPTSIHTHTHSYIHTYISIHTYILGRYCEYIYVCLCVWDTRALTSFPTAASTSYFLSFRNQRRSSSSSLPFLPTGKSGCILSSFLLTSSTSYKDIIIIIHI